MQNKKKICKSSSNLNNTISRIYVHQIHLFLNKANFHLNEKIKTIFPTKFN